MKAQGYSRRNETIGGNNIAIETYQIGDLFHSKAEIDVMGAGARIASASAPDRSSAESKVLQEVRAMFGAR